MNNSVREIRSGEIICKELRLLMHQPEILILTKKSVGPNEYSMREGKPSCFLNQRSSIHRIVIDYFNLMCHWSLDIRISVHLLVSLDFIP